MLKPTQHFPPRLAERFLRFFLKEKFVEEVSGDLEEKFQQTVKTKSLFRARLGYWIQVIRYLRPFALRSKLHQQITFSMFRSYIKIGWRNLLRNKAYSVINISGLAIGLACSLAIGLFIADEFSYDRFHKDADRIYRVVQQQNQAGDLYDVASTPGAMADAMKKDFAEVEHSCLIGAPREVTFQQGNVVVESLQVPVVDAGFFKMFDFPLVMGNPDKLVAEPNQVVLTERMAENLYGHEWATTNVVGKIISNKTTRDNKIIENELIVTGVIKNPPTNSHIQFDALLAYDPSDKNENWGSNNFHTYIRMMSGADPTALDKKLETYFEKYAPAGWPFGTPVFSLQPMTDIYLHSDFDFQTDWNKTSSITYLRIFLAVGLIVLLIAVFNFINLSTARAIRRAKEVGVRKTVGALFNQLVIQFLSESFLMTFISVIIAVGLVALCLPFLNGLSLKSLTLPFGNPSFYITIFLCTVLVSILAGLYPSFYLSNFQPGKVLKGTYGKHSGSRFRQVLVIAQFTFSVILVVGTIVIYQQLTFLREKNLGFDQAQLIFLNTDKISSENALLLKEDLQQQSSIINAASASNSLIDVVNSTWDFHWEGKGADDNFLMTRLNVDPDYFVTTGISIVEGRNFELSLSKGTPSFLVNVTAAKRMGWTPAQALGKSFEIWGEKGTIIGVVNDFHFKAMTASIDPLVFVYRPGGYYGIMIKAGAGRIEEAITVIEGLYKKYEPSTTPRYNFVDQELQRQYAYEQRTGKLVLIFSVLAIFVACLGLYGLAAFTAEQRKKEIGIRKVLGASVGSISTLLSRDFVLLVVISILIASPTAWYLMQQWLSSFAYRIDLQWSVFVAAGIVALIISILTVLYEAISVATTNPVRNLRSE